jgi:ribosomal protein S18 acetylase RimI-like enzyme
MTHEIRVLAPGDASVLDRVADQVFDEAVNAAWAREFLADPRHHLVVAIDEDTVVGFASAVHYVHPDKAPQLWINEVGVAPAYHRRGIGRAVLAAILERGRSLGCTEAWVLTEEDNTPARGLYQALGGVESECIMYTISL